MIFVLAGLGLLFGQEKRVFGKSDEESLGGKILRIEVGEKDLVNNQSFKFWGRLLDRAKDEGAKGIIFDLDTPGGLAFPTEELMTEIANVGIPTVAFVNPNAISAGSFIAISCDEIYMTPGSKIGSSAIVSGSGMEIGDEMRAKLESYFGAQVRYIAKQKGHDPKVIEAMMFLSDEERQIGDVTVKPGQLLNLNSSEATKMLDDGPLLAEAEVKDLEKLLEIKEWQDDEVVTAEPSGFEALAWWIASYSGILIMIGLGGGYFELKTPGFGIGGVVSLAAFGTFFFGNYMAGNLAGYELAALFVLGLALIAVEIFVLPGFGVAGISGFLLVLGSLAFSMLDEVQWQEFQWGGAGSDDLLVSFEGPLRNLAIGIFGSLFLLFIMFRYLPQLKFVQNTMLPGSLAPGDGESHEEEEDLIGMTGEVYSQLRPSGRARINGEIVEVRSETGFIEKGKKVRVVSRDGMGLVVEKVPAP